MSIDIYSIPLYYISFKKNTELEKNLVKTGFNNINHFAAVDGRKLKLRDGYCIALDTSTMKCRLHDVFKPSTCLVKPCGDSIPEVPNFNWSKEILEMQKEIDVQRHGRVAEKYFESIFG